MSKIKNESQIKCQWCTFSAKAEDWDKESYNECVSREMRRAYKKITDQQIWGPNSNHFYKCVNCGHWSRGNQLLLVKENGDIDYSVGGQPILKVSKRED